MASYHKELEEDPEYLIKRQQQEYQTDLDHMFCACPVYQLNPYHICKHLIRLITDLPNIQRSIRPNFGTVYRQSCPPLLWIKDVHSDDQRHVQSLQNEKIDSQQAGTYIIEHTEEEMRLEPDSDGEALSGGDFEISEDTDEGPDADGYEDEDDRNVYETEHVRVDIIEQGEEKLMGIRELKDFFLANAAFCEQMLKCKPDDAYLGELPQPTEKHIVAWNNARKRHDALQRANLLPPTFGGLRTGAIFASMSSQ